MRFIDLFAGIGGFHYGLTHRWLEEQREENLGVRRPAEQTPDNPGARLPQPGRPSGLPGNSSLPVCVYANEWDKYACSVYRRHYEHCDDRDIRTIEPDEIPDHDLLCAGFPCQAFSVAGKRGGFTDTRGTLFFEITRIARAKRPRLLLLENVKGLLSHDSGRTFATILMALDELGYDAEWQVLNSKDWGVPQNRERVFIIGSARGKRRPEVFPLKRDNPEAGGQALQPNMIELTKHVSDAQRVYDPAGIAKTLKGLGGGMGAKTGLYATRQPLKFMNRNQKNIKGDYAYTVDSVNTGGIREGMTIRRLTPRECERLQGFPDDWTKYDNEGRIVSDAQRYKMCGNAVTTNVVAAIAAQLLRR